MFDVTYHCAFAVVGNDRILATLRQLLQHRSFGNGVTNTLGSPRMLTSPKHQLLLTQQLLRVAPM